MKIKLKYLVLIVVAIVLIMIIFWPREKKENNNQTNKNTVLNSNNSQISSNNNSIKITEQQLKSALQKTEKGIAISDVKIISNQNQVLNIGLNVKNENVTEKIVNIIVKFYDQNDEQIGENGFSLGLMAPNENKNIENNCMISNGNISKIGIEVKSEDNAPKK